MHSDVTNFETQSDGSHRGSQTVHSSRKPRKNEHAEEYGNWYQDNSNKQPPCEPTVRCEYDSQEQPEYRFEKHLKSRYGSSR